MPRDLASSARSLRVALFKRSILMARHSVPAAVSPPSGEPIPGIRCPFTIPQGFPPDGLLVKRQACSQSFHTKPTQPCQSSGKSLSRIGEAVIGGNGESVTDAHSAEFNWIPVHGPNVAGGYSLTRARTSRVVPSPRAINRRFSQTQDDRRRGLSPGQTGTGGPYSSGGPDFGINRAKKSTL